MCSSACHADDTTQTHLDVTFVAAGLEAAGGDASEFEQRAHAALGRRGGGHGLGAERGRGTEQQSQ